MKNFILVPFLLVSLPLFSFDSLIVEKSSSKLIDEMEEKI